MMKTGSLGNFFAINTYKNHAYGPPFLALYSNV